MLPRSIVCEECGETALVRGYGRVEYAWDRAEDGSTILEIRSVRLTVDCPACGVCVQEFVPRRDLAEEISCDESSFSER
jgi:hypothetical protein